MARSTDRRAERGRQDHGHLEEASDRMVGAALGLVGGALATRLAGSRAARRPFAIAEALHV